MNPANQSLVIKIVMFHLDSSLWLGGEPIIRDFRVARVDKFTSDAHAKRLNPAIRAPQGEIAALRTTLHAGECGKQSNSKYMLV